MSARGSFGSYCRSTDTENQEVQKRQRGQAAAHGLHRRAAAAPEDRVPGEPLHHGAAAPGPGPGAAPERVPDQDLVPEQTRQDQEGQRLQERPGAAADGAGTVQPLHHHHPGGQGGQRLTLRRRLPVNRFSVIRSEIAPPLPQLHNRAEPTPKTKDFTPQNGPAGWFGFRTGEDTLGCFLDRPGWRILRNLFHLFPVPKTTRVSFQQSYFVKKKNKNKHTVGTEHRSRDGGRKVVSMIFQGNIFIQNFTVKLQ